MPEQLHQGVDADVGVGQFGGEGVAQPVDECAAGAVRVDAGAAKRNGSSHRGQASIDRLEDRWPTLRLIHLPVHASWLNQVEIYFSVVQRKVVSPNDFHTLDEVESRLLDFQQYYEQIATPFEWKFTKNDLNALLKRIADHENTTLTPAA